MSGKRLAAGAQCGLPCPAASGGCCSWRRRSGAQDLTIKWCRAGRAQDRCQRGRRTLRRCAHRSATRSHYDLGKLSPSLPLSLSLSLSLSLARSLARARSLPLSPLSLSLTLSVSVSVSISVSVSVSVFVCLCLCLALSGELPREISADRYRQRCAYGCAHRAGD